MAERNTGADVKKILVTKLGEVSTDSKATTPSPCIFKAPRELRRVNEGAFEPQIISIGPYHHDKPHLKAMETHKVRYLHSLLQQGGGLELESYIAAYMEIEQEVRNCYAERDEGLSSAEFGAIMVLDALFVVQLICKFKDRISRVVHDEDDYLFKQNLNLSFIAQDLLLLENQLPFILLQMYAANKTTPDGYSFGEQAFNFFSFTQPLLRMRYNEIGSPEHLLGLVHYTWIQFPMKYVVDRNICFLMYHFKSKQQAEESRKDPGVRRLGRGECDFISSATELSERGIRFRQGEGSCLFDIRFEHGTLLIPTLIVDHDTERIIRNLIAYEQFKDDVTSIVMDYARFIDCLVNYAADVALLCDRGVIINRLGSNEDVANMINKLNNYVYISTNNFSYSEIFDRVNERCKRPWSLWKVNLRQTYFNTPWDWVLTSIAAAALLLVLSSLQTIFSVLAYFKQGAC